MGRDRSDDVHRVAEDALELVVVGWGVPLIAGWGHDVIAVGDLCLGGDGCDSAFVFAVVDFGVSWSPVRFVGGVQRLDDAVPLLGCDGPVLECLAPALRKGQDP